METRRKILVDRLLGHPRHKSNGERTGQGPKCSLLCFVIRRHTAPFICWKGLFWVWFSPEISGIYHIVSELLHAGRYRSW